MGSPSEPNDKGIDAKVGGLVWVRRRNGSWWPGQIIDADECSESFMASPRSGTPIKLLGREDASVDFYNLEKSKRVKSFRCGEYDDCIEKAKLAAANSSKKAVKYARRDDAILHALEIEMEKTSGEHGWVKESMALSLSSNDSECMEDDEFNGLEVNASSFQDLITENPSTIISSSAEQAAHEKPRRTPNDSEDDGTKVVKRMRGLDDLGMGAAAPLLKRKRTLVGPVHEFLKRKHRRRPLTKVLENTTMVSVPVVCEKPPGPSEFESNGSNRSLSLVINNSDSMGFSCGNKISGNRSGHAISGNRSGHASEPLLLSCRRKENEISSTSAISQDKYAEKLFDVPFIGGNMQPAGNPLKFASQKPPVGAGGKSSQCSLVESVNLGNEELYESVSTSSGAADADSVTRRIEKGNAKWQLKGKRNSRNKTVKAKKPNSRMTVNTADDILNDNLDEYWGWSNRNSPKVALSRGAATDAKLFSSNSLKTQRLLPYRQSRFMMNPKYGPDFSLRNYDFDESNLYDVPLVVKASSRPQDVPYISLLSKLTGQPVTGHPLTVEVLKEGSTDHLLTGATQDPSSIGSGMNVDMFVSDYKLKPRKGGGRVKSKDLKSHHVSPVKSTKLRKGGSSSKKIRKLSSLTGKLGAGERELVAEKIVGPVVACVPLKLVFSRINASLKGSMCPPKRVIKSGDQ